ncbi:MAG: LLM class flavin-dependent oxidoreductase, partial [Nitrospinota bacterium]|nr:LLM class flavin-dependent oxidoreductase [Nitrospinota bacterium]
MQFGYTFRAQFPPGEDMQARFGELLEQARAAEKWGYDSITKGSHLSSYPLQMFQQLPFLARVAAEAPKLRLIAGIVLLPLHNPLQVAEEIASLDVMTGGRMVFGIGLGYREVEFRACGTTQRERVPRLLENLEAIKRLWTEEKVDMKGSHFALEGASCSLKPVQKPYPPIWVGADSDPGIVRAAEIGDCWFINPHVRADTLERQIELYKNALERCGKPYPAEMPIRRDVFVARTREDAIRLSRPSLEMKYKTYHQWGQDKAMPEGDNNFAVPFEELME